MESYGNYSSGNYGVHCMRETDLRGVTYYYSYQTLVAFCHVSCGIVCLKNYWSTTTNRHLNFIERDKNRRVSQEVFDKKLADLKTLLLGGGTKW